MAQNKDMVADAQTLLEENLSEKKSVESARRLMKRSCFDDITAFKILKAAAFDQTIFKRAIQLFPDAHERTLSMDQNAFFWASWTAHFLLCIDWNFNSLCKELSYNKTPAWLQIFSGNLKVLKQYIMGQQQSARPHG